MRADLVFDAGPNLVAVAHWHLWSAPMWPGTDQQTGIILVGKNAIAMAKALETRAEIIGNDRVQRLFDVRSWQNVSQIQQMCPPLTKELIGQTALAELVSQWNCRIDQLNIIFAIP